MKGNFFASEKTLEFILPNFHGTARGMCRTMHGFFELESDIFVAYSVLHVYCVYGNKNF